MSEQKRWSDEEVEILRDNYGKNLVKNFCHLLPNWSVKSIRDKARLIGLKSGLCGRPATNGVEIGKTYGKWTVIEKVNSYTFMCKCECGRISKRLAHALENDDNLGCMSCCRKRGDCGALPFFMIQTIKRGAQARGYEYELEDEYLLELYHTQNKKCALTGLEITFSEKITDRVNNTASLDRIDNKLGYIKGNVQWVHKEINALKNNFEQERFIELCRMVANYNPIRED